MIIVFYRTKINRSKNLLVRLCYDEKKKYLPIVSVNGGQEFIYAAAHVALPVCVYNNNKRRPSYRSVSLTGLL